jgi:tape measure domain-containing protein
MSGVEIKVRADTRQARKEISNLERSIQNIDKRAERVTKAFRNAAIAITGAFAGTAVTKGITRATDSMTQLRNRVNLVTQDTKLTKQTLSELFQVARDSRSSVDAAAETFNRFGLALADADKPIGELLKVTKAVNQAAVISGASSESAKAAIIQLGQGLASGQLRGQELNSVLEQTPRLARAIATGMGIPFGELREQAAKGLITAEAVYGAILDGAEDIQAEFATLDATVADLSVLFGNELTRAIAELDKAVGISASIKSSLELMTIAAQAFADNFGKVTAIVAGEFQIFLTRTKFFVQDANNLFKSLFTGDFDPTVAIDNIIGKLKDAQEVAAKGTTFAINFAKKN